MSVRSQFLVYLLVDKNDRIQYVGRGTHDRAMAHDRFDINEGIAEAYKEGDLRSLVLDCGTEHAMEVTEGALIDALTRFKPSQKLANRRLDKFRFSPSRVPEELADRQLEDPLTPESVAAIVGGPVLYVSIKEGVLPYNDRGVIDPIRPDPAAIADRIQSSWWLDPWMQHWHDSPEDAPKVVAGLAGRPHDRYILGALEVPTGSWPEAVGRPGFFHEVPWAKRDDPNGVTVEDIDAAGLCGRRVSGVTFSNHRHALMRFYDKHGGLVPRP